MRELTTVVREIEDLGHLVEKSREVIKLWVMKWALPIPIALLGSGLTAVLIIFLPTVFYLGIAFGVIFGIGMGVTMLFFAIAPIIKLIEIRRLALRLYEINDNNIYFEVRDKVAATKDLSTAVLILWAVTLLLFPLWPLVLVGKIMFYLNYRKLKKFLKQG